MPQNTTPWKKADAADAAATKTERGGVFMAAHQAHSTAADTAGVVTDLNALIDKLTAAGIIADA